MASKAGEILKKGGGIIINEFYHKTRESGFDIGSFMRKDRGKDRDTSRSRQLQADNIEKKGPVEGPVSGGTPGSGQLQADIVKNQGGPVSRGTPGRGGSSDGSNNP